MGEGNNNRLESIRSRIRRASTRFDDAPQSVTLVAVSKTFPPDDIVPLLEAGQRVFGENRVQEAMAKWPELRARYGGIELHLIGPLQSNKVKEAVAQFDVIESVDREKLATSLARELKKTHKKMNCFVQVNIGLEPQKSGIAPAETVAFVARCRQEHELNIVGLMCIPPAEKAPGPYFAQLAQLAEEANAKKLSMGMSADFESAIAMGASHVRIGSALFGGRSSDTVLRR